MADADDVEDPAHYEAMLLATEIARHQPGEQARLLLRVSSNRPDLASLVARLLRGADLDEGPSP